MSTVVSSIAVRPINASSFDDLTCGVPALVEVDGSELRVTFDADLDPATVEAVRARMATRDDADQAARANLANLRDTAATGDLESVRTLTLALTAYLLGET